MAKRLRLISWNVNGIRSVLKKGFLDFVKEKKPDILCLQETKTPGESVELDLKGYHSYWNHAQKKGYSGTLILSKAEPIKVTYGLGKPKHDGEGRVITAEYPKFSLVNVYVPNAKRDLSRLPYRQKEWDVDFLKHLKKCDKKKPVIYCGDMNVAHEEIDLTNPKTNHKNHGFTKEEREGFSNMVKAGFVDSFRHLHPGEEGHYTWWSQMGNCRKRNIGWRIDYFGVSKRFMTKVKKSQILPEVMGSDHCPVALELSV